MKLFNGCNESVCQQTMTSRYNMKQTYSSAHSFSFRICSSSSGVKLKLNQHAGEFLMVGI